MSTCALATPDGYPRRREPASGQHGTALTEENTHESLPDARDVVESARRAVRLRQVGNIQLERFVHPTPQEVAQRLAEQG